MTHLRLLAGRVLVSRRAAVGLVLLGVLAIAGIFAELVAGPAPIVAFGPLEVLPAVVHPDRFDGLSESHAAAIYADRPAIWPIVRCGPGTLSEVGSLAPMSAAHPLGTDMNSRDVLARVLYGARTALLFSLGAAVISIVLGAALGGLAGLRPGFWNDRLVRFVETVDTFPAIIVVALVRAMEATPSALSLVIAVSIVRWAEMARLVRAEVLRASNEEYVLAARAIGASPFRIFWFHILRNAIGPVLMSAVFGIASFVLLETALSFLEMGAPTRDASWGETLAQGAKHPEHIHLLLAPGLVLLATIAGSHLFADAVREAMDPHATGAHRLLVRLRSRT